MKKKLLLFVSLFGLLCIPLPTIAEEQDCNTPEISQTTVSLSLPTFPEGVSSLKAVFEVAPATEYSDAKKVVFSKGNLAFYINSDNRECADNTTKSGHFYFQEKQYMRVSAYQNKVNETMDLFNYGSSGYTIEVNSKNSYATHSFVDEGENKYSWYDWGLFNAISNGGNQPGLWRTMTESEWTYLISHCKAKNHFAMGQVQFHNEYYGLWPNEEIRGIILLPDEWVSPSGISFTANGSCSTNSYSTADWEKMSNAGAVFLPANPEFRSGADHPSSSAYENGYYWTATYRDNYPVLFYLNSNPSTGTASGEYQNKSGYAVRLVHDL